MKKGKTVPISKTKSEKKKMKKGKIVVRTRRRKKAFESVKKEAVIQELNFTEFQNFGDEKIPKWIKNSISTISPTIVMPNMTNLINLTHAPDPIEEMDEDKKKSFWIVGGDAVYIEKYKENYQFMCSVLRKQDFNGKTYIVHSCGCTVIAPNVVLTAAHCADYADYVKVGKLYRDTQRNVNEGLKVDTFRVKAKRKHGNFDDYSFANDVMLLKLSGRTEKSPAQMKMSNTKRKVNEEMTVVGWGFTSSDDKVPASTLRDVKVKYVDIPDCKDFYGDLIDDKSQFCAYDEGKDACQGDSGGPVLKLLNGRMVQVGIVSWGYKCGEYPGVYTDLSKESISRFIHTTVCHSRRGLSSKSCINGRLPNII